MSSAVAVAAESAGEASVKEAPMTTAAAQSSGAPSGVQEAPSTPLKASSGVPNVSTPAKGHDGKAVVDEKYFLDQFSVVEDLKVGIPQEFTARYFFEALRDRNEQLSVVSSDMSSKVLADFEKIAEATENMALMADQLELLERSARKSESHVTETRAHIAGSNLQVIANVERREHLTGLLNRLEAVKKIHALSKQLKERIKAGDFSKSIALCLDCSQLIKENKDLDCVKLIDINEEYTIVKEKLDEALRDSVRPPLNRDAYLKNLKAFRMIRKAKRVVARMGSHLLVHISSVAQNTVLGHVLMSDNNRKNAETVKKLKFASLVKHLEEEQFLPCLQLALEQCVDLMFAHVDLVDFHETVLAADHNFDAAKYYNEVGEGIEKQRKAIWEEIQRVIATLCSPSVLGSFRIENFLAVLDRMQSFADFGEEFSGEPALKLNGMIKQLSVAYYQDFHFARMENLRSMIEREMWSRCPVEVKYSEKDIKEFKAVLDFAADLNESEAGETKSAEKKVFQKEKFKAIRKSGNPFARDALKKAEDEKRIQKEKAVKAPKKNYDDDNPELNVKEVDEPPSKKSGSGANPPGLARTTSVKETAPAPKPASETEGPLLTTTTINVVKLIGQYMNMMKTLPNIATEVFQGIVQLVHFYTWAVFHLLGPSITITPSRITLQQRDNILSIANSLVVKTSDDKILRLMNGLVLSEVVENTPKSLFALTARSIAAESLLFVRGALLSLRSILGKLLPRSLLPQLQVFYSSTVESLPLIRGLIYKGLCAKLVPADKLVELVRGVNWTTNDIPMSHSIYVDHLMEVLVAFKSRLASLEKVTLQPTPLKTLEALWESMAAHCFECLVEGFSVDACSNEGRAMMGIDLQNLILGMDKKLGLNVRVQARYVELYVKAFYISDDELEAWVTEHSEYTKAQLTALVNSGMWDIAVKRKVLKNLSAAPGGPATALVSPRPESTSSTSSSTGNS